MNSLKEASMPDTAPKLLFPTDPNYPPPTVDMTKDDTITATITDSSKITSTSQNTNSLPSPPPPAAAAAAAAAAIIPIADTPIISKLISGSTSQRHLNNDGSHKNDFHYVVCQVRVQTFPNMMTMMPNDESHDSDDENSNDADADADDIVPWQKGKSQEALKKDKCKVDQINLLSKKRPNDTVTTATIKTSVNGTSCDSDAKKLKTSTMAGKNPVNEAPPVPLRTSIRRNNMMAKRSICQNSHGADTATLTHSSTNRDSKLSGNDPTKSISTIGKNKSMSNQNVNNNSNSSKKESHVPCADQIRTWCVEIFGMDIRPGIEFLETELRVQFPYINRYTNLSCIAIMSLQYDGIGKSFGFQFNDVFVQPSQSFMDDMHPNKANMIKIINNGSSSTWSFMTLSQLHKALHHLYQYGSYTFYVVRKQQRTIRASVSSSATIMEANFTGQQLKHATHQLEKTQTQKQQLSTINHELIISKTAPTMQSSTTKTKAVSTANTQTASTKDTIGTSAVYVPSRITNKLVPPMPMPVVVPINDGGATVTTNSGPKRTQFQPMLKSPPNPTNHNQAHTYSMTSTSQQHQKPINPLFKMDGININLPNAYGYHHNHSFVPFRYEENVHKIEYLEQKAEELMERLDKLGEDISKAETLTLKTRYEPPHINAMPLDDTDSTPYDDTESQHQLPPVEQPVHTREEDEHRRLKGVPDSSVAVTTSVTTPDAIPDATPEAIPDVEDHGCKKRMVRYCRAIGCHSFARGVSSKDGMCIWHFNNSATVTLRLTLPLVEVSSVTTMKKSDQLCEYNGCKKRPIFRGFCMAHRKTKTHNTIDKFI